MISIQQLENPNPNHNMEVEWVKGFLAEHTIDRCVRENRASAGQDHAEQTGAANGCQSPETS